MNQPVLFLMLGYPGAGKTTTSKIIAQLSGAVHIWADHERRAKFASPTHSKQESDELYSDLNTKTGELLAKGQSVIFDTSFNHFSDRDRLREIAAKYQAKVVLICINTPRTVAKDRAVDITHANHNKYEETMSAQEFERIADHLEPPKPEENAFQLNGSHAIDESAVRQLLVAAGVAL